MVLQADLTKAFAERFGRENLSISKTFGEVAELSALLTNVGGEADTNQTLTYRMLTLVEGRSLTPDVNDRGRWRPGENVRSESHIRTSAVVARDQDRTVLANAKDRLQAQGRRTKEAVGAPQHQAPFVSVLLVLRVSDALHRFWPTRQYPRTPRRR